MEEYFDFPFSKAERRSFIRNTTKLFEALHVLDDESRQLIQPEIGELEGWLNASLEENKMKAGDYMSIARKLLDKLFPIRKTPGVPRTIFMLDKVYGAVSDIFNEKNRYLDYAELVITYEETDFARVSVTSIDLVFNWYYWKGRNFLDAGDLKGYWELMQGNRIDLFDRHVVTAIYQHYNEDRLKSADIIPLQKRYPDARLRELTGCDPPAESES